MAMADSPSESAFADLVVEFLDTATHQILYQRGIYPQRVFTRLENTVHRTSVLFTATVDIIITDAQSLACLSSAPSTPASTNSLATISAVSTK